MKEHKISKVPSSLNEDLQLYVATPSQHGSPVNFQSTSVDWDHLLCAQGPHGGSQGLCRWIKFSDQVALGVRLASLNEHLHVSRARTLEGGWGGRVLRTSPAQNPENLSPSSESERCEIFLDFDVKGLA